MTYSLQRVSIRWVVGLAILGFAGAPQAWGSAFELFAKGSASKNNLSEDKYTISVSASTGIAITLIPRVRIEGRYTNTSSLQNKLEVRSNSLIGTLNDIKTQTTIYSVGIDLDLLGPKSALQPFIYLGAGYVETERSSYFVLDGSESSTYFKEPKQLGVSANVGAGVRVRIADAFALELELFGYGVDIHKPNPLLNLYATAGVRLFI